MNNSKWHEKLLDKIKSKWWYISLFIGSSIYVFFNRKDIYDLNSLNVRNLIFIIWIVLLILPLFSEVELLGVKLKKEVEKAKEEVKVSLQNLQTQLTQIQLNNSIANNFSFTNGSLPSEQKIEELLQMVSELQKTTPNTEISMSDDQMYNNEKTLYLFKARLGTEMALRELCEKLGYENKISIMKMAEILNRAELINGTTCDLIGQVSKIANRGIHGEIVSDEYLNFVKETYPEIQRQLKIASDRLRYTVCPKCKYSGYSVHENVCPQCGYVHADE
ncbi:MAG: hypothetical protein ACC608_10560 [Anaerofustis sp.]